MRYIFLFIVAILAMSFVLAEPELYVVVGDDAPTSDVVTAANFAGFMASNGHTFQSSLASQIPDEGFIVFIDDDMVYLSGEFSRKNTVTAYFTSVGMRVKEKEVSDVVKYVIQDAPTVAPIVVKESIEEPEPVLIQEEIVPKVVEEEVVAKPLVEKKSNVIVRFFRWIFG